MSNDQIIMTLIVLLGLGNVILGGYAAGQRGKVKKLRKIVDGIPRVQRRNIIKYLSR